MRRAGPAMISLLLCARIAAAQEHEQAGRPPAAPRVAILPTHAVGIDPVVAEFVDQALQRAVAPLGCELIDVAAGRGAQQALALAAPLSLGDLWRVTHHLRAELGVSAIASARGGKYVLQLRVASSDGRGPFFAHGDASEHELQAMAERALAEALASWREPAGTEPQPVAGAQPAAIGQAPAVAPGPAVAPVKAPAQAAALEAGDADPPEQRSLRLAVHNDVAFGLAEDSFVNDVLGARADLRLTATTWLGLHAGYANLQGRAGRVHGFLPYAQIEQRMPFGPGRTAAVPLRLGLGYLVRNGAFLRLSSGLAIPLGARTELVLDLLAPAFWATPDRTLFSLDAGVELNLEL